MWRYNNVGGLGEHVTCHMFPFSYYTFSYIIFGIAPSMHKWIDLGIYRSIYPYDALPHIGVSFRCRVDTAPNFGDQNPQSEINCEYAF